MTTQSAASQANLRKFQDLLRDLFQFDCADLDFGIYRIMNHKRDAIEKFISRDLPRRIAADLEKGALDRQARAAANLEEAHQNVVAALGRGALDADGKLADSFHSIPLGKAYLEAQAAAAPGRSHQAVEADTYNHLYTFFSRYYQDGDFISRRRYGRNQRYAIPYNGEEVYLHWANSDQYYVKTAEHFHNYDWKAPNGVTVHFRLQAADVEQNNVKGDRRFFLPQVEQTAWDADTRAVTIPFQYRPLTVPETGSYGARNQQDKIIETAVAGIPQQLDGGTEAQAALTKERQRSADDEPVTYLEHHLRQYARRNDSDFFIHKDLHAFLSRELDFYLKNEVLNLDTLENAGERAADGWFQQMRLIKSVGGEIIDFLAQIEGFQKMLWEKRKFVVETNYCVTLGNVDTAFYTDIASNDAQWEEWRDLLDIDGSDRSEKFLDSHPTLPLDTRHFGADFTDRLLASFGDLDGMTDGLLVHSDNWQALRLMDEKYKNRVKCVHIDPPYNTSTSGFLYKNGYQHSSWLAMMHDRILAGNTLLNSVGAILCHIDENEYENLNVLFTSMAVPDGGTVIWDKKNPMLGRRRIATQHEYVLWRTWDESSVFIRPANIRDILNKAASLVREHAGVSSNVKREFRDWIRRRGDLTGGERAYQLIDDDGRVFQSVAMGAPEPRTDPKFHVPLIHPVTYKPCPVPSNGWSRAPETLQQLVQSNEIIFGKDETVQPRRKVFLTGDTRRQMSSVISDSSRGKMDVDKLGLEFPYCHPVSLYEELMAAAAPERDDLVLDYFAGSGTTGHAVINLNREDGGQRRFILVEMGEYFDTVLLPRIKKVTYSPEWKDGSPKREATTEEAERSPRIVKYMRLESYEDALDSIAFDDAGRLDLEKSIEGYLLKYMLKWETKHSETLLNAAELTRPFDYRLRAHSNGVTRERTADVAETFAYLLGLNVRKRQVCHDGGRRYLVYRGETRDAPGRSVAVICRKTEGWTPEDFARDRKFVKAQGFTDDADAVYVNGDSVIPNAKAIEPIFKKRMFAGVQL